MIPKFVQSKDKGRLIVRVFTTYSLLPSSSYFSQNASLAIDPDVSFSITRVNEEDEYFELAWAAAKEVALYSSVVVGARPEYGKVFLFPARWPYYVSDVGQDLSNTDFIEVVRRELKKQVAVRFSSGRDANSWEELPPFLKGLGKLRR